MAEVLFTPTSVCLKAIGEATLVGGLIGGSLTFIVMKSWEYYKGYRLLQEIKKGNYVLVKKPEVKEGGGKASRRQAKENSASRVGRAIYKRKVKARKN